MVADAGAREANEKRFDLSDPRDRVEDRRFRGSFSGYETNASFCGRPPRAPSVHAPVPPGLSPGLVDGRMLL